MREEKINKLEKLQYKRAPKKRRVSRSLGIVERGGGLPNIVPAPIKTNGGVGNQGTGADSVWSWEKKGKKQDAERKRDVG